MESGAVYSKLHGAQPQAYFVSASVITDGVVHGKRTLGAGTGRKDISVVIGKNFRRCPLKVICLYRSWCV